MAGLIILTKQMLSTLEMQKKKHSWLYLQMRRGGGKKCRAFTILNLQIKKSELIKQERGVYIFLLKLEKLKNSYFTMLWEWRRAEKDV